MRVLSALAGLAVLAASAAGQDVPPSAKPPAPKIERKLAADVDRLAVSPDGRWLAAVDRGGGLTIFSTETDERKLVRPSAGKDDHAARFDDLVFTQDSAWLVAVPKDADDGAQVISIVSVVDGKEARTIDVSTKREPGGYRTLSGDPLHDVGTEPGGSKVRLLRQSVEETWDAATGQMTGSVANKPYAQRKRRSPDGSLVAGGATSVFWVQDAAGAAEKWKVDLDSLKKSGNKVASMTTAYCTVLGFRGDGKAVLVYTSSETVKSPESLTGNNVDKRSKTTIRLEAYAVADGKPLWRKEVSEGVYAWGTSAAGDFVAYVDDGKLAFLNAATGQTKETLSSSKFSCVAAAPDGLTFWAGCEDGQIVKAKTFAAPKAK